MKKLILTITFISSIGLLARAVHINRIIQPAAKLSGRYILKGSVSAGFNFISLKKALWYNDLDSTHPDTLKIKWVDGNAFLAIATAKISPNCPPRVDYYKIVSTTGKQLILKSVWTGWNDFKDQTLVFNKQ